MLSNAQQTAHFIIVFDGVCNFCNGWVAFVSKRDRARRYFFSPAQSDSGRKLLASRGYSASNIETMLLVSSDSVYERSDAALRALMGLGGMWKMIGVFLIVPRRLRDAIYTSVARNRFRIAGRRDTCEIPYSIVDKDRFIP
jgi:predicted DCC family thiol-disulfide oxidoreductase YuxK